MKCIFVSFFNSNNIGDRLISNHILQDIIRQNIDVIPCSYEECFTIQYKKKKLPKNPVLKFLFRVRRKFRNILFWIEYEKRIKEVDFLIIGGGNMIMDLTPKTRSAKKFGKFVVVALKHKKPIAVLSIGIGPFASKEQLEDTRLLLSECDYVTYRDKNSFELGYKKGKAEQYIAVDPVFMMEPVIDAKKNEICKTIAIGVINNYLLDSSSTNYMKYKGYYIDFINALLQGGYKIKLFSTELDDYQMINDIYTEIFSDNCEVIYIENEKELLDLYSEVNFVIAARMHSLIVAFTQKIPIIGLSWQQKINSMFNLIEREGACFKIEELSLKKSDIIDYLHKHEKNNEEDSHHHSVINKLKKRYDVNRIVLNKVILKAKNTKDIKTIR